MTAEFKVGDKVILNKDYDGYDTTLGLLGVKKFYTIQDIRRNGLVSFGPSLNFIPERFLPYKPPFTITIPEEYFEI